MNMDALGIMARPENDLQDRSDQQWMGEALTLARRAELDGEVPVGAIVVRDGRCIGQGWNRPIVESDPTAHAEIRALRDAGLQCGNYRLPGSVLYVTLEPCCMCAGAMFQARIARVVFGAPDPRAGAAGSVFDLIHTQSLNHSIACCGGVRATESAALLRAFFKARR